MFNIDVSTNFFSDKPLTLNHFNYLFETETLKDRLHIHIRAREEQYYIDNFSNYMIAHNPNYVCEFKFLQQFTDIPTISDGIIRIDKVERISREENINNTFIEKYLAHSPRVPWRKQKMYRDQNKKIISGINCSIIISRKQDGNVLGVIIDCSDVGELIENDNNVISLITRKNSQLYTIIERLIYDSHRIECKVSDVKFINFTPLGDMYDIELYLCNYADNPYVYEQLISQSEIYSSNTKVLHRTILINISDGMQYVKFVHPWFRSFKYMSQTTYLSLFPNEKLVNNTSKFNSIKFKIYRK